MGFFCFAAAPKRVWGPLLLFQNSSSNKKIKNKKIKKKKQATLNKNLSASCISVE